jgi:hypothetical protein
VTAGDPKPYVNVGTGELFAAVVVLALVGIVLAVRSRDRWSLFVVAALVLSPVPSALTDDRYYSLRLLPLPVLLLVLAIPPLAALRSLAAAPRRRWLAGAAAVGIAASVAVQTVQFVHWYRLRGPGRTQVFEAALAPLLQRAIASGPVYIDHDDHYAQAQAQWYVLEHGLPAASVSMLPDGGIPPEGATVFGRIQECDYTCVKVEEMDTYWVARAEPGAS